LGHRPRFGAAAVAIGAFSSEVGTGSRQENATDKNIARIAAGFIAAVKTEQAETLCYPQFIVS
jgi:hypothetical protein